MAANNFWTGDADNGALVELTLTFHTQDHSPICNSTLRQIREQVAQMLENSEFGRKLENDDQFGNEFAIPVIDQYFDVDNELFLSFSWVYPLRHGNFKELITTGLFQLKSHVFKQFHIYLIARIAIS